MRAWVVAVLLALAAVLGACSDADESVFVGIGMQDNFFTRDVTRIDVGDTIRFSNDGQVPHNAIDVDGQWSTGEAQGEDRFAVMAPGETAEVTLEEEGVYTFYCSLHAPDDASSGMTAVVTVGDVEYQADDDAPAEPVTDWTGTTRRVPEDHPTIQNAVDAADPGDLVLVEPAPETDEHLADDGEHVWFEQVEVTTPYVTVRGTDRDEVIIDGEFERPNAISVFAADGVAVENLTVRNATGNGVFFTSLTGYRTSYVTAYNNGVYGIYSFDAVDGLFEHSYAGGSPDAGFYVGQCDPCDAVITDVIAENNALGYSGTNASDVYLVDSVWRHNIVGIAPNTLDSELLPPFERVTVVGNLVHDNDNRDAPALDLEWPSFGNGVMLAGGEDSLVERNRIINHARSGVFVTPNLSSNFWMTGGNVVRDNVIEASGYADLTLSGPAMAGNCFAGNGAGRTEPVALERMLPCGPAASAGAHAETVTPDRGALAGPWRYGIVSTLSSVGLVAEAELGLKPEVDYRTLPPPEPQPDMPEGAEAPVVPAVDVFAGHDLDLDALAVPDAPEGLTADRGSVPVLAGVPLGLGLSSTIYTALGWLLPLGLLAGWLALALIDLARREELARGPRIGWSLAVLAVPYVGAASYLVAGRPGWPAWLRWLVVAGGLAAVLVGLTVAATVGGIV